MKKLKHKEIKTTREEFINDQRGICGLCEEVLDSPSLDHNHKTGEVRMCLCRGCNLILGKIENNLALYRLTNIDKLRKVLNNIPDYITRTHTELIHPKHKTK